MKYTEGWHKHQQGSSHEISRRAEVIKLENAFVEDFSNLAEAWAKGINVDKELQEEDFEKLITQVANKFVFSEMENEMVERAWYAVVAAVEEYIERSLDPDEEMTLENVFKKRIRNFSK